MTSTSCVSTQSMEVLMKQTVLCTESLSNFGQFRSKRWNPNDTNVLYLEHVYFHLVFTSLTENLFTAVDDLTWGLFTFINMWMDVCVREDQITHRLSHCLAFDSICPSQSWLYKPSYSVFSSPPLLLSSSCRPADTPLPSSVYIMGVCTTFPRIQQDIANT